MIRILTGSATLSKSCWNFGEAIVGFSTPLDILEGLFNSFSHGELSHALSAWLILNNQRGYTFPGAHCYYWLLDTLWS